MKYSFLPEAETEYLDAVDFYESQQAKLGLSLIHEFESTVELIIQRPISWRLVHPTGIRCVRLSRFPYSVFYRLVEDEIQITAFAHHRRHPEYWLKRIK